MAVFNPMTLTGAGENLLAQAVAGEGTLSFTSVSTSSAAFSGDPKTTTELQDIVQTVVPLVAVLSGDTIQVSSIFSNDSITQEYIARTVGIYAKINNESPVLFAIAVAADPDTIPAQNPISPSTFYYQFNIAISDASNVTVSVPEDGSLPASVFYQKLGNTDISQIADGTLTGAINQNTNVIGGDAYDSSKSYAAGDYFIYNNQLCKALTAISAGTSLSEGTNYETTSLENEIAGLNGKSDLTLSHDIFTSDILVYKRGNTVTMTYTSDVQGNIPSGEIGTLFTLPEGYRPPNNIVAFTGPNTKIQVRIGPNGSVYFYNYGDDINSIIEARFTLTYVTA